jgi:hypothetical protein
VIDQDRIKHLRELCLQAQQLRIDAEKLCGELAEQLERSLTANPPTTAHDRSRRERRRTPRDT